jgi:hypothetical protein
MLPINHPASIRAAVDATRLARARLGRAAVLACAPRPRVDPTVYAACAIVAHVFALFGGAL